MYKILKHFLSTLGFTSWTPFEPRIEAHHMRDPLIETCDQGLFNKPSYIVY